MVKAVFNGTVVAETEDYEVVEGNVYFPPESIKPEFFSDTGSDEINDGASVDDRTLHRAVAGRDDDLGSQHLEEVGKAASVIQCLVLRLKGDGTKLAGHGDLRNRGAVFREVAGVDVEDPFPGRVEVDLGLCQQNVGAQLRRQAQKFDLGGAELLAPRRPSRPAGLSMVS